ASCRNKPRTAVSKAYERKRRSASDSMSFIETGRLLTFLRSFRRGFRKWWPHSRRPAVFILALRLGVAVSGPSLSNSHERPRTQARAGTQLLAGRTAESCALQMTTVVRQLDYFSRHLGWVWLTGSLETFNDAASGAMRNLPPGAIAQVA